MSRDDKQHDSGRRDFLRLAGFTVAGTALTGCSRGLEHGVMPFLVRPEEVTPGKAYWYASVCGGCAAGCGILAKGRDGRPIKLEGNPENPLYGGGLCAVGQASVVGLYDARRLHRPLRDGQEANWADVDREIGASLETLRSSGSAVRFLTDSVTGPGRTRGHRRVPVTIPERPSRDLRPDLDLGHRRSASSDARGANCPGLSLRPCRDDRLPGSRLSGFLGLAGGSTRPATAPGATSSPAPSDSRTTCNSSRG